jgi:hypothetical protein
LTIASDAELVIVTADVSVIVGRYSVIKLKPAAVVIAVVLVTVHVAAAILTPS